ncbi:hypothetical protein [Streptomyces griseus]|uniref:hypothetical protein n=1 Tax=Streptomyces griseus TaxID=1911 RepID=UPI00084001B1|nr:hypothetical protein [Streptomyces griseus]
MNVWRTLTTTAAGTLLLAVAPAAQADDLAPVLTGTALTAADAGTRTGTAVDGVARKTGLARTASAAVEMVQAGADEVGSRDRSVHN